ncbi:FASCICLIN-like arabinogalactan 1 [Perilla frutescens var. frutescens]|nr:FASCICLIN-like arabinogalactan 1 [Perilla frutescens var. frutescens]
MVCAIDNAGMSDLLSKHLTLSAIKNMLSLHVLLDYFDAKKLHQITNGTALAATMFQATCSATGSAGFINITDLKGGFGPQDNGVVVSATFVKSVDTIPYFRTTSPSFKSPLFSSPPKPRLRCQGRARSTSRR